MKHLTKAWDWTKNDNDCWLIPAIESPYLAKRWTDLSFKTFLDLGCGLGRHSVLMAKDGFDVTSVDLSEEATAYLNSWAQKENLDIKTLNCDMTKLPFPDNCFDCALAFNVIYHTDTKGFRVAIDEIYRVLKPGGEIFLTLLSKNTYSYQNKEKYEIVDENTIIRNDMVAEMGIPHFYTGIEDIEPFFSDWEIMLKPRETCDYVVLDADTYSRHWQLLLRKH